MLPNDPLRAARTQLQTDHPSQEIAGHPVRQFRRHGRLEQADIIGERPPFGHP
jgi:hypothetical protein